MWLLTLRVLFHDALHSSSSLFFWLNQKNTAGAPPENPINEKRAARDPAYDTCNNLFFIEAGAPGNFHNEPCIYEADLTKIDNPADPWSDPVTGLGYPNWSFFIPGNYWLPGLLDRLKGWIIETHGEYPVIIHPNTGCESRDHFDPSSFQWFGEAQNLTDHLTCNALGCNQA